MDAEYTELKITCPKCGSKDIANLMGDDDAIVSCNDCGEKFGTSAEVREKAFADAKKQAIKRAQKTLKASFRNLGLRR